MPVLLTMVASSVSHADSKPFSLYETVNIKWLGLSYDHLESSTMLLQWRTAGHKSILLPRSIQATQDIYSRHTVNKAVCYIYLGRVTKKRAERKCLHLESLKLTTELLKDMSQILPLMFSPTNTN